MPTSNEKILDSYIRHQTYVIRYSGGLRNQVLPYVAQTEKDLDDAVTLWSAKASNNRNLTGNEGRKWQRDFEEVLRGIREPAWDEVEDEVLNQIREFAVAEAAIGATAIESALPVVIGMTLPPADKLVAIVNSQPFEGRTLKGWVDATSEADVQRILKYVKTGIVQGLTPTEIARGVTGTKRGGYTDGIGRKSFTDMESVLLTVTNGVQQEAKQALYEANSDIVKDEYFVATLDVRTTLECAANDGGIFPRGTGPIPPLHFRCRSLRVPYINPDNLRNRPFDSSTEKELLQQYTKQANIPLSKTRANLPRGHKTKFDKFAADKRRELVGTVPAKTTYQEFLKKQSAEFQKQVLGPTRYEMFKTGDLTLDKFVARDGDTLTLDELRRKGLEVPDG